MLSRLRWAILIVRQKVVVYLMTPGSAGLAFTALSGAHYRGFLFLEKQFVKKICLICSKEFEGRRNAKICSESCRDKYKSIWQKKKLGGPERELLCVVCRKPFKTNHRAKKCCSPTCSAQREKDLTRLWRSHNRGPCTFTCVECGQIFERHDNRVTCSEQCRGEALPKRRKQVSRESAKRCYQRMGDPRLRPDYEEWRAARNRDNRKYLRTPRGWAVNKQKGQSRRALLQGCAADQVDYVEVDKRTDGNCAICGGYVDYNRKWPDPLSPSHDHIVPLVAGGSHCNDNLQLTHLRCNLSKGRKPFIKFGF